MSHWYEEWFNTKEYLNLYRNRNEGEAKKHVDFILNNVKTPPGSSILDLACGPGRHSIIFAQRGYNVTAVDLSNNLLSVARDAAAENGLNICFIKSDLRDIKINCCFDIIINLFTSFGYFEKDEDNYTIFDVALKHLNYKGKFVIDFFNKHYLLQNLKEYSEETFQEVKYIQKRSVSGSRIIKEIKVISEGQSKKFFESVRLFSPEEIICALNDRGFIIDRTFGDFDGKKFDPQLSERIIIFAEK